MEFSPILILLIFWLLIGLPIKKLNEAARKKAPPAAKQSGGAAKPAPAPAEGPSARPSVMQPTISVSEHDDSVYMGSLNAVTGEGYDPCHDEQLSSLRPADPVLPAAEAAEPGLRLGWTGSDVVRGFVMSEILKRKQ